MAGLEEEVERKRTALLEASKERKILENLREHQIVSYRKKLNRDEQAFMDELSHMPFGKEPKTSQLLPDKSGSLPVPSSGFEPESSGRALGTTDGAPS